MLQPGWPENVARQGNFSATRKFILQLYFFYPYICQGNYCHNN
jgi:hypothetical protein